MKLEEIAKEPVYVTITREAVPGQSGYGKFRVQSLERTKYGWDVGINAWTAGVFSIPAEGKQGIVFRLKNGMPISTQQAANML